MSAITEQKRKDHSKMLLDYDTKVDVKRCDCCWKGMQYRVYRWDCITCSARKVIQAASSGRWCQERVLADICRRTGFKRQAVLDAVTQLRKEST